MDPKAVSKSVQPERTHEEKCEVRYSVIILCAAAYITTISQSIAFSIGTLFVDWAQTFESSKSQTAWVVSLCQGLSYLTGPLSASLCGKLGDRVTVLFGSLIASLGMATSALCNNISHLYITYGVMAGIGFGIMMTASFSIVGDHFTEHRPFALAVVSAVAGLWVAIFPYLFRAAGDTLGWRGAHFVIASLVVQSCVMGALLRPFRTLPSTQCHTQPGEKTRESERWWHVLSLCKNNKLVLFLTGYALITLGGNTIPAVIVDYSVNIGMTRQNGAQLLSLVGAGGVFGRCLVLPLITRQWAKGHSFRMLIVAGVIRGFGVAFCASTELFLALLFTCFIYGMGVGMQICLFVPATVELFGIPSKQYYIGFGFGAVGLGTMFGAPVTGAIVDALGSYHLSLYLNAAVCLSGSILTIAVACLSSKERSHRHQNNQISVYVISTAEVTEVTKM